VHAFTKNNDPKHPIHKGSSGFLLHLQGRVTVSKSTALSKFIQKKKLPGLFSKDISDDLKKLLYVPLVPDPEGVLAFKKKKDRNYPTLKGSNKTTSLNLPRVSLCKLGGPYNFDSVGDYSIRIPDNFYCPTHKGVEPYLRS
jgi:hypothetical protein